MNFNKFFYFCGSFLPSWIRIRIPNLDPQTRLNPDPIRIQIHNPGSFVHGGNSSQAGSKILTMSEYISSLLNLLKHMPRSPLTGQFKEKPTYRVRCLYRWFVHVPCSWPAPAPSRTPRVPPASQCDRPVGKREGGGIAISRKKPEQSRVCLITIYVA